MSSLGNAQRVLYDSRGNAVQVADAQADSSGNASALDTYSEHLFGTGWPDVAISGPGNKTHATFDGVNRLRVTTRDLTADGTGSGAAAGSITTQREYDKDSRLTAQLDDKGNRTEYVYDAVNRRAIVRNADGTQKLYLYDRAGNLRYTKDERGVVSEVTVDILGRATGVAVSRMPFGPGQESYGVFGYDGLSRVVYAENNHAKVTPRYDSLGPVIKEDQTVNVGADRSAQTDLWPSVVQKVVNAVYDGVGNRTQLVYPGSTTVNETYDANDRKKLVKDGSTVLADYQYAGPGYRMLEKRLSAANVTLFRDYDGDRRVTRHDWRRPSDGMRIAGFTYAWDRVGNRWFERTLTNNTNATETNGNGWAFAYDSVYRMRDWYDGAASASLNSVVSNSPRLEVTITATSKRSYDLDGVGNRNEVVKDGVVEVAYALEGADALTNQYSRIDDMPQAYDPAGNLVHDGTWRFYYSAKNQLLQSVSWSGDARYRYGPFGRRVSKRMATGNFTGLTYGHSVYVHFGQDLLEEETTAGVLRKEWVYGIRIDEPIRMRAPDTADIDNDFNTTEIVPLYYLTSSIGTVWALVDGSGVAKERYTYDVWGTLTDVIDKNGASTGAGWTLVGNPWTFTGRQYDFEERTGLYHYRARAYRPGVGEFLQRDPLGVWGDSTNLGSSRGYVRHNPGNATDPQGLAGVKGGESLAARGGRYAHLVIQDYHWWYVMGKAGTAWYDRWIKTIIEKSGAKLKPKVRLTPKSPGVQRRPDIAQVNGSRHWLFEIKPEGKNRGKQSLRANSQIKSYIKLFKTYLRLSSWQVGMGFPGASFSVTLQTQSGKKFYLNVSQGTLHGAVLYKYSCEAIVNKPNSVTSGDTNADLQAVDKIGTTKVWPGLEDEFAAEQMPDKGDDEYENGAGPRNDRPQTPSAK